MTWQTNQKTGDGATYANYTYYYIAHNTADVNFHTADGSLIQKAIVSTTDFPYLTEDKPVTMTRRYQSLVFGEPNNVYSGDGNSAMSKDPTSYTSTKAELGTPATAAEAAVDGYFFVGWAEPARMKDYECAYAFDLSNGTSKDGKPQYISSSVDKARAYTLRSDALVEQAMELYPVYVPLGQIETTTNLSDARGGSFTVPGDPTFVVTDPNGDGIQTVTVTADMDALLPDGSGGFYKLLYMTISVDGGDEVELPADGEGSGVYPYEPIEPGHSYLFTAYYEPYAVVFHKNGTTDMLTQLYNRYDHIRNTPLPTVQDVDHELDNYIFIGWTEQVPESGVYIKAENMTSYDEADAIYHFVDDGTSVSHAMELWPVYTNIRVAVNSNIDEKVSDPSKIRMVYRDAADSVQTRVVATEVEGYKFYGWYIDIPENDLTNSANYTKDNLVSKDSSYHLTGDKPYKPTIYTARYIEVYKVIYHDLNGQVLETEYVYEGEDHPFVIEQTLTDENGVPMTDKDNNVITRETLYNPTPFYAIHENMTAAQTFDTWVWVKTDGGENENFADFCKKNIIGGCFADTTVREMHLYPIVWTISAIDSNGAAYDKLVVSGSFTDGGNSVSAYFDGETTYSQPSLTVHVEKNQWTVTGDSVTSGSDDQENIPVTLYPDDHSEAKPIGVEDTNKNGDAVFYFGSIPLTIKKTGGAELAGQTFLFTVSGGDWEKTVAVTCKLDEGGKTASGTETILLPAGSYSVAEDAAWAYRYDVSYKVFYGTKESEDSHESVSVSQVGNAMAQVVCTNTPRSGLRSWLFAAAHNENQFKS